MINATILEEIRAWHLADRRSTIQRTFALGDLIVKAVIHTGMTEYEVIKRIMADLGELAMGMTSYNRAARMSRTFTDNQRAVLIDKAVSIARCEVLCGEQYVGRKRIKVISDIKADKLTDWRDISGIQEAARSKRAIEIGVPGSKNNPNCVAVEITQNGVVDEDAVLNVLKNLISRVGGGRMKTLWAQALREMAGA